MYSGPEMIGTVLQKLPATIHDLSQPKDFIVDAFQHPLGTNTTVLQVTIYGEFKEGNDSRNLVSIFILFDTRTVF